MGHPFGDLISQHLHRKHGLSQSKLAEGILQSSTVISDMCHGRRLSGPQARERVTAIIGWLHAQGALETQDEANALLAAAGMASLRATDPAEARLVQALASQPSPPRQAEVRHAHADLRLAPRHNLPAQLTRFIGREAQVNQLVEFVQATRLLTLTGSGGVGKTRLALEVGAQVREHFIDGVWLVDFAPLADSALIAQTVAQLFRLPERPGHTYVQTVTTYLEAKQALFIFDNCEHLVDACAGLAEELLRHCPQLHLLVTSRELLRAEGEVAWRVPSLTRPPLDNNGASANSTSVSSTEELLGYESVRLFLARTHSAQVSSAHSATHLAAIAQICSQLDGIPLALEMAAARINAMTAEEIAAQLTGALGARFRLLTSGARTAPLRQRTLLATLEWSYALLLPAEQLLLARLAVFAGGWTAEAARAVCAEGEQGDLPPDAVLPALLALVQKSLVIAEPANGQTRYRMLETVRQYATEKLAACGEEGTLRDRHLHYYLTLAEQPPLELISGPRLAAKLMEFGIESDNLRAALVWTRGCTGGDELCLRLAGALWVYWYDREYHSEGRAWLEEALARGGAAVAPRARALMGLAYLDYSVDTRRMAALAEQSLALSEEVGYLFGIGCSLMLLGAAAWRGRDYAQAQVLLERSIEQAAAAGATGLWGTPRLLLGIMLLERGEQGQATAHFEAALASGRAAEEPRIVFFALEGLSAIDPRRALALCEDDLAQRRNFEDLDTQALVLYSYGHLLLNTSDTVRAITFLEKAAATWRALGDVWSAIGIIGRVHFDLGRAFWLQGDLLLALECYQESLRLFQELGDNEGIFLVLAFSGYVALAQQDLARAAVCFHTSLEAWCLTGEPCYLPMILVGEANVAQQQGDTPRAARLYGAAAQFGPSLRARPPSERVGYERLMADARLHLEDAAFAAAWAEGEALTLEQAVALALAPA